MVLGLGRTGLTLARTLQGLGAKVKVGVRREEHFARAWEMGFEPFYTKDLAQKAGNIDLLFNTIPTMIVTAQIIANIPFVPSLSTLLRSRAERISVLRRSGESKRCLPRVYQESSHPKQLDVS